MPSTSPCLTVKLTSFDQLFALDDGVISRKVSHFKDHSPGWCSGLGKSWVTSRPTISEMMRSSFTSALGYVPTVRPSRKHGYAVGEVEDFVELVRDVDHPHAARAQVVYYLVERRHFGVRERGRRLVQHQYARLRWRAPWRSRRAAAGLCRGCGQACAGRWQAQVVEQLLRAAVKLAPSNDAKPARLATEKDILAHGHVFDERKLLIDYGYACRLGVADGSEALLLAVDRISPP